MATIRMQRVSRNGKAIGFKHERRRLWLIKTPVRDTQRHAVSDALQDGRQETLTGRHFFEANMLTEILSFIDEIIDSEGIDKPFTHRITLDITSIFDVISLRFIEGDRDLKKLFNCNPPAVKGTRRDSHFVFTK